MVRRESGREGLVQKLCDYRDFGDRLVRDAFEIPCPRRSEDLSDFKFRKSTSCGRNTFEILRVIDLLQTADKKGITNVEIPVFLVSSSVHCSVTVAP